MPIHTSHNNTITKEKILFIKSHLSTTHIVADFDGTLTQYFDDNKKSRPSIISLLYNEWILDDDYTQQAQALHDYYVAIEHNHSLPYETRQTAMEERRTKHKELLMHKWLNIKHIEHIATMNRITMRLWVDTFLHEAANRNIPVIIFSASGIGVDSITLLLQHRWLLLPNIHIVSNKLYRDDQWNMVGYSKPVIHSLNKTESVIQDNSEYKDIQQWILTKPHAIVLGDGIWDAWMVDERDNRTILKVGLCNDKIEDRLQTYENIFDIVITNDDSLDELYWLIFWTNL